MNRMTKMSLIALCLCGLGSPCGAENPEVLKQLLIGRIEAFSKSDTAKLGALCTKSYELISSTGSRLSLDELKKAVATSAVQIKAYTILSYQPYIADNEQFAFAVAEVEENIVQGTAVVKNSLIMTEIYKKEKKNWKILLTQISQKICTLP